MRRAQAGISIGGFPPDGSFVLFDDARAGGEGRSKLFCSPHAEIAAYSLDEVAPALAQLREAGRRGDWCAGFLSYEAGFAFEPRLAKFAPAGRTDPLLWFGCFAAPAHVAAAGLLPRPEALGLTSKPRITEEDYLAVAREALGYICAGDIYQINLTFPVTVSGMASPLDIYRRLRGAQRAPHGALIRFGGHWGLSLSPELFFALDRGKLATRPMKGTMPRCSDAAADQAQRSKLAADPKNRAENLMIVDLLRNDLSRVCEPGSVRVPRIFEVETYPTLHQMTSTVEGQLRADLSAVDVIEALFPCGSITGAPKIRAMELIAALENGRRGLYTGSIGWISPQSAAEFNVAIRTLLVDPNGAMRLNLGSALVADSDPHEEWRECLLKGKFVALG